MEGPRFRGVRTEPGLPAVLAARDPVPQCCILSFLLFEDPVRESGDSDYMPYKLIVLAL